MIGNYLQSANNLFLKKELQSNENYKSYQKKLLILRFHGAAPIAVRPENVSDRGFVSMASAPLSGRTDVRTLRSRKWSKIAPNRFRSVLSYRGTT